MSFVIPSNSSFLWQRLRVCSSWFCRMCMFSLSLLQCCSHARTHARTHSLIIKCRCTTQLHRLFFSSHKYIRRKTFNVWVISLHRLNPTPIRCSTSVRTANSPRSVGFQAATCFVRRPNTPRDVLLSPRIPPSNLYNLPSTQLWLYTYMADDLQLLFSTICPTPSLTY